MNKLLVMILLIFSINTVGFSKETTKQKQIRELFEITNVKDSSLNTADGVLNNLLYGNPNITDKQKSELAMEMKKFLDYMIEKQLELYDKHYTEKEIKEMLAFYKTPTGKSVSKKGVVIQKEWTDDMTGNYLPGMSARLDEIIKN